VVRPYWFRAGSEKDFGKIEKCELDKEKSSKKSLLGKKSKNAKLTRKSLLEREGKKCEVQ
jgi:hypothetical protein